MNLEVLKASLNNHEGRKNKLYRDTEGHLTGGVGHNFDEPLPEKLIDLILEFDISVAIEELDRVFPSWRTHSSNRQNVLVELMVNMGAPTLQEFRKFWYAMGQNDYETAANELLSSKWATQVHSRADTLAAILRAR